MAFPLNPNAGDQYTNPNNQRTYLWVDCGNGNGYWSLVGQAASLPLFGAWSSTVSYKTGDHVYLNNGLFEALTQSLNQTPVWPTDTAEWKYVGEVPHITNNPPPDLSAGSTLVWDGTKWEMKKVGTNKDAYQCSDGNMNGIGVHFPPLDFRGELRYGGRIQVRSVASKPCIGLRTPIGVVNLDQAEMTVVRLFHNNATDAPAAGRAHDWQKLALPSAPCWDLTLAPIQKDTDARLEISFFVDDNLVSLKTETIYTSNGDKNCIDVVELLWDNAANPIDRWYVSDSTQVPANAQFHLSMA